MSDIGTDPPQRVRLVWYNANWYMLASVIGCFVAAGLFFVWGAATVQLHIWPHPLLKHFGDYPTEAEYALINTTRRSVFNAYQRPIDVVFLGDSITAEAPWHEMFPGIQLANRGIGGERFGDMATRLDDVVAMRPKAVFIMGGINSAEIDSLDKAIQDLDTIIKTLRGQAVEIVLQTAIEPRGKDRAYVQALNLRIDTYAAEKGLTLVDLTPLSDDDGLRTEFTMDGTHLTGRGYQAWEDILKPHVAASLAGQ